MWISVRRRFAQGHPGWERWQAFSGLRHLAEVRSVDAALNPFVGDSGRVEVFTGEDVEEALRRLPRGTGESEFALLVLDAEVERIPEELRDWELLGHDLSDHTFTSSLLNCGPWTGVLEPFTHRLNRYGLLSREDAVAAKQALPEAWPGDPHAEVTVWALYGGRS